MTQVKRLLAGFGLFFSFLLAHSGVFAAEQKIVTDPASLQVKAGEKDMTFTLTYTATDDDGPRAETSGLGVAIYFDSTQLAFKSLLPDADLVDREYLTTDPDTPLAAQPDDNDGDGDPKTDSKAIIAYFSLSGRFASSSLWSDDDTLPFGTVTFDLAETATENTTTTIRYVLDGAAGFDTSAAPVEITVQGDDEPPVLTIAADSITIEAEGALTPETTEQLSDFIAGITAQDNVQGDISDAIEASIGGETAEVLQFALGDNIVDLVVKDSSGNEATGQVTVTVVDTTGPLLSGVNDVTLAAENADGTSSAGQLSVAALDLVDGPVDVVLTVGGDVLPGTYPIGTTEVTVTATDTSNNASTASLVVTVSDQTGPVILAASGVTLEATGPEGYVGTTDSVIAALEVTDNVDGTSVTVELGEGVEGAFPLGTTNVAVTATDSAGNATNGTVPVLVEDSTGPEFSGAQRLVLTVDTEIAVSSGDERVANWLAGVTAFDTVDGETAVESSELPESFPFGEEVTITFSSVDSRGNESTVDLVVLVAIGPSIAVPDSLTVVSLDGEAVAKSQTQIAAFIESVSATDFDNNVLEVSNNAPDVFPVGETTTVTFTAVDAEGREGENSAGVTVIAASGDNDTDEDGIDDLFEVENGLDPNDSADADADADGDGRSNLDEYLEGKDPNADDVEPVVTAPEDVVADATGRLTKVDLGLATATDVKDGELTPVADDPGPFMPGAYTVTWTAIDAAGNQASDTQEVLIRPQIATVPRARTSEGSSYEVVVVLNGPAASYPVTIPFTLGGSADVDSDYTVSSAEAIVIEEGRKGILAISVNADEVEEGNEEIVVTFGDPQGGAVLGSENSTTVTIVEAQVPPALRLEVVQGDKKGKKVSASAGSVSVLLTIKDPNGEHSVDWAGSDAEIVPTSEAGALTFEFDPAELDGGYEVIALVTDSGIAEETFTIATRIFVKAGDVVVEADSDGDGIPDSKDVSEESNVIAINADESSAAVTADQGVTLVLGDAAQASETAGIAVSEDTIASGGADGSGEESKGADEDFDYPAGVYDFQVQDLPIPGQSVRLVIPVPGGVPANAVMRKYTDTDGWFDFVIDEENGVATAAGDDGACPSVGSELYVDGLTEGDTCLQLTVQDGGPNDADGTINGEYDDPSGIAEAAPVLVVEVPASAKRKSIGGCSVAEGPGDFGLILLAILGLLGLARKQLRSIFVPR